MSAWDRFQLPSLLDEQLPPCCDDCSKENCVEPCDTLKTLMAKLDEAHRKDDEAQYQNWLKSQRERDG